LLDDILLYAFVFWALKVVYLQNDYMLRLVEFLVPAVVWRIPVQEQRAALTIDDVPLLKDLSHLEAILDVLKRHDVTATFFIMSGFTLPLEEGGLPPLERDRCLALLRRAVAEGHELGNHLQFDTPAFVQSPEAFDAAFLHCDELLAELVGREEWRTRRRRWFRPASGLWNRHILAAAAARGYTTVLGNCFPHDVAAATRCLNAPYLAQRARRGSILLVHDRWHTPATLDQALPQLAARVPRLRLGTLSALQAAADSEASCDHFLSAEGRELRGLASLAACSSPPAAPSGPRRLSGGRGGSSSISGVTGGSPAKVGFEYVEMGSSVFAAGD